MGYKKIANELYELLTSELEEKFDYLYEIGEIEDNGLPYEDQRDAWVDRVIIRYTSQETYDAMNE